MRKLTKEEIWTLPNFLSVFRLCLLFPVLLALARGENATAFALLLLSAASDVLDGTAARALGEVSDLGKLLDPVADKITLAALLLVLAAQMPDLWFLFALLLLKESFQLFGGFLVYRRRARVTGAHWYGKLATAALYVTVGALILFPSLPPPAFRAVLWGNIFCMFTALIGYAVSDYRALSGRTEEDNLAKE